MAAVSCYSGVLLPLFVWRTNSYILLGYDQGPGETLKMRLPSSHPPSTTSSKVFLNSFIHKHSLHTIRERGEELAGTNQLTEATYSHSETPVTNTHRYSHSGKREVLKLTNRNIYDLQGRNILLCHYEQIIHFI